MVAIVIDFISRSIQFFYELSASMGIASYGIAIALFTVAVKVILFPLTRKQYVGMAKMQQIQPELQKIQKKYKNNPEKQQKEMMALYQKAGVSPFASCLPILIQLPILLALFTALQKFFDPVNHPAYVNLDKANFLWIPSLGSPDPIILPILVAVGTFLQQKITMKAGGVDTGGDNPAATTQKVMLYFMPLFIGYISRTFPSGLALYWVIYSILGIAEQLIIKRPRLVKEEARAK
ncbi:MAG TPA: membrane protein insertase YidC [Clostridia bacterium]|jgi:YidC/Oxa1 family membrane protein insertase|nr:membrane protein insertase YidC [Clostridia bacterium]